MLRIKHAHTAALREKVFRLRYRAYRKEDAILPNASEAFEDAFDRQPNHVLWALTDEDKVVGSVRVAWYDPKDPHQIPEMGAYSDELGQAIPVGTRILSSSRFVTDPDVTQTTAQFAQILMRHVFVTAAEKLLDWGVTAVRSNHVAFYRRTFGAKVVSEARLYPGLRCPMHLLALRFTVAAEKLRQSVPLLRPQGNERVLLDPQCRDLWEQGLPVAVAA